MSLSVFDLFKIGIGPSSSHTVGPMKAAYSFLTDCQAYTSSLTNSVQVRLYGSLAATGAGHATDRAIILGLKGATPETIEPDEVDSIIANVEKTHFVGLPGERELTFDPIHSIHWHAEESLPEHPNGLIFSLLDEKEHVLLEKAYFSIGGGFVTTAEDMHQEKDETPSYPYEFDSAKELISLCHELDMSVGELMWTREMAVFDKSEIKCRLRNIWSVMESCIERGLSNEGILPGGLNVKRRAPGLYKSLTQHKNETVISTSMQALDWINLYALAVNEENADGGRIVTAPTNGAAGIVPAVLKYLVHFYEEQKGCAVPEECIFRFFMAAAAVGILCKKNASISGAEVGCQGEVGSACAMAAAGLAEALGASPEQVENAAEIGLEHNLGLTCDPVAGLVQVPCIERNAIAAVKAINAAQMALRGDGQHFVSLDKVIKTMRDTGADMQDKYKETSKGGLAVNLIEC